MLKINSQAQLKLIENGVEFRIDPIKIRLYSKNDSRCIKIRNGCIFIYEWIEYRVKISPENLFEDARVYFGDEEAEKDEHFWRYTFKNYIGTSKFRVYHNDKLLLENDLEVISSKFAYLGDKEDIDNYIDFVETIKEELIRYSLELPFDIRAPTEFQIEESLEPISPLFAYHFFKKNRERIISAYEQILSMPYKRLEEQGEWVNLTEATTVDEDLIIGIISKPEFLRACNYPLSKKIGGFVPEKVHQWKKYESLDTPENRFVKYFLKKLDFWLEEVLKWIKQMDHKISCKDLIDLQSYIEMVLNNPILSDIGDLNIFPSQSQVLLKREGYQDILELWRQFNAYAPTFNEICDAIANKRVDILYEYWCLFELIKKLKVILGGLENIIVPCNFGRIKEEIIIANFKRNYKLVYNRKFYRINNRDEKLVGSYSVPLKPDYTLLKDEEIIAVFDAKFRFEDKFARLSIKDLEKEEEHARKTGNIELLAKLSDIFKMHTYKDALKANIAVILYPGNANRFFTIDGKCIEDFPENILRQILNDESLRGIGFLSFIPSKKVRRWYNWNIGCFKDLDFTGHGV